MPTNPVVFMKPTTSVAAHGAKVVKPRLTQKLDYEVELAVVIGKRCKDVKEEEALDFVLGYTVANDLSTRDWQIEPSLAGSQWCRSKAFDGFAPLGPVLTTRQAIPDPGSMRLRTFVNGEKRQDSCTSDLIFSVAQMVSFLSAGTTLEPGCVILTGTPEGVAMGFADPPWLQVGDRVVTEIEGIGTLEIEIVADPAADAQCYANTSQLKKRKERAE